MLRNFELGARGAQMFERCLHVRLIGPRRSQPHRGNGSDENNTNF